MSNRQYNVIVILLLLIIVIGLLIYETKNYFEYIFNEDEYVIQQVEVLDVERTSSSKYLHFQYYVDESWRNGIVKGCLWEEKGDSISVAINKTEPWIYARQQLYISPTILFAVAFFVAMLVGSFKQACNSTKRINSQEVDQYIENLLTTMYRFQVYNKISRLVYLVLVVVFFVLLILYGERLILSNFSNYQSTCKILINLFNGTVCFVCFLSVLLFCRKQKRRKLDLEKRGVVKCVKVNTNDLSIQVYGHFYKYHFNCYLIEDNVTRLFQFEILDAQKTMYQILLDIKNKGTFPDAEICVDSADCQNYKVLADEFMRDVLLLNKNIVVLECKY